MKVVLQGIQKKYGRQEVLHHIQLTFENGIYGLIGPNGAGKSTLIRIMVGLEDADEGSILCDDVPKEKLKEKYYDNIGYMPQYPGFYKNFTGYEMMTYYASLKGMKKKEYKSRIISLLEFVNLTDRAKEKVKTYSGGMKQRLAIACALLNNPKLLILDEPTAGLDPKERIRFRNLLTKISEDKIVIIATHIVSDVEYIANKIILLQEGNVLDVDTVSALCKKVEGKIGETKTQDKETVHDPKLEDVYLYYFDKDGDDTIC